MITPLAAKVELGPPSFVREPNPVPLRSSHPQN